MDSHLEIVNLYVLKSTISKQRSKSTTMFYRFGKKNVLYIYNLLIFYSYLQKSCKWKFLFQIQVQTWYNDVVLMKPSHFLFVAISPYLFFSCISVICPVTLPVHASQSMMQSFKRAQWQSPRQQAGPRCLCLWNIKWSNAELTR